MDLTRNPCRPTPLFPLQLKFCKCKDLFFPILLSRVVKTNPPQYTFHCSTGDEVTGPSAKDKDLGAIYVSRGNKIINKSGYRVGIHPKDMASIETGVIIALLCLNLGILILGISFLRKHTEELVKALDQSISQALVSIVENVKSELPMSGDINPVQMAVASFIQQMANRPPELKAQVIPRAEDGKFSKALD